MTITSYDAVGQYVTTKFNGATIQDQPPVSHNGGRVRTVIDHMVSVDLAENATILMARLPSNAVLHPQSEVHFDDMGTGVTLDIGTANATGGTDDPDAINAGIDVASAAGSAALFANITDHGKALWELAGLSSDPGGNIDVYGSLVDANPDAGDLSWCLYYSID